MKQEMIQPATTLFALDRAWKLTYDVGETMTMWTKKQAQPWFDKANGFSEAPVRSMLSLLTGLVLFLFPVLATALVVSAMALFFGLWAALLLLQIGLLTALLFLYTRLFRIHVSCPACHEQMPVPTFMCNCGRKHTRLWPNRYGVWTHRCECTKRLPTLDLFGRGKMRRICAHCNHELPTVIGQATDIHIALVGGRFAGKTHYMAMSLHELMQTYQRMYDYAFSFIDPNQNYFFSSYLRTLMQGKVLSATNDTRPQAYNLKIKVPGNPVPKVAFLYDAGGEVYGQGAYNHLLQAYYHQMHAILFIVDPFSIDQFYCAHRQAIDDLQGELKPSKDDVMQVYERMMEILEIKRKTRKRGRYRIPIAVVMTKSDAFGLEGEIGYPAAQQLLARDSKYRSAEDAMDALVQGFLQRYGLGNLVRELHANFTTVRYFSCSALGRLPSPQDQSSFAPRHVLNPLAWLLARTHVIKRLDGRRKKGD